MNSLYAVIMAGGRGTRFWPVSRRCYPKQLLTLSQPRSMLQQTVERLQPLIPYERIIVVTTSPQAGQIKKQLPSLPAGNILVETVGRNTSAAIAMAAFYLRRKDPRAVMAVLPADHIIKKEGVFRDLLSAAARLAVERDCLITLGIKPDCPNTGYGYIVSGPKLAETENFSYNKVVSFEEKPQLEKAKKLLADGNAFWNSGMFVWRLETIMSAIQQYLPDIYQKLSSLEQDWDMAALADIYPRLPSVSIDYGVMEAADNVVVFPADLGWNDLGSWASLGELFSPDEDDNISPGKLLSLESRGLTVYSPDKLVAAVGVEDLIVVDTGDVLLICSRQRAQDVKQMVDLLEKEGLHDYL